ncbi:B-cell receptor-associated protein 31-like [Tubulanus polymorphus]|uniref:B-cell receptor-associated protein 31-like n=1 Tax=Tubulanus polymorphus TaxID=672921 RepID=UPI003DA22983
MSLQWTFVATFLYTEIFFVILLLVPWISAARWQKIFKSRLLKNLESHSHLYFNILIVILVILFMDAIRDVRNYSSAIDPVEAAHHPQAETMMHMKLFRAQRNFYIAGFALFLWLVLKRLVGLICSTAVLNAQQEAALKQAKSASETAKRLLEEKENKDNSAIEENTGKGAAAMTNVVDAAKSVADVKKELDQALLDLEKTREELHHSKMDLETMQRQAQSTNKEYDRLMDEHSILQRKLATLEGAGDGDKKDD